MFSKGGRLFLVLLATTALPVGIAAQAAETTGRATTRGADFDAAVAPLTLPAGTVITVLTRDVITSRQNEVGDLISAKTAHAVSDTRGRIVIPAGAEVRGVISRIEPEEEDDLILTFFTVEVEGIAYPLQARVLSLPTRQKRRGNAAGDAAKVGAGAAVGAIAGRIIGGNREGTLIGALTGAAAGAGTAVATRTDDVVVDPGTPIQLQLVAPFHR